MWKPSQVNWIDIPVTAGKFDIDLAAYVPARMYIKDCMTCDLVDSTGVIVPPKDARRHFQEHPTQAMHEVSCWNPLRVEAHVDYLTNKLQLNIQAHPKVAFEGWVRLSFRITRTRPINGFTAPEEAKAVRALIEIKVLDCVRDPVTFIEHAMIHGITYIGCYDGSGTFCNDLLVKVSEAQAPTGFFAFDIIRNDPHKATLLADLVFDCTKGTFVIEKYSYGMTHLKLVFEVEHSPKSN